MYEAGSNPVIGVCLTDPDCDHGNECTEDICNDGTCEYSDTTDACDDLLLCNGADTCAGGSCSVHAGDPCTGGAECADTCDEGSQTSNTSAGTPCTNDGNPCTDNECDGAGSCAANGNSDPCDDGDACTDGELFSGPPLVAATQEKPGVKSWGDIVGFFDGETWLPPNGTVNIDDAVPALKTFQDPNAFNATHVSVTDLEPALNGSQINKLVSINDVFSTILGFRGAAYPGPEIQLCEDP